MRNKTIEVQYKIIKELFKLNPTQAVIIKNALEIAYLEGRIESLREATKK